MPFNIFNAPVEVLQDDLWRHKNVSVAVLRLDKIHPVVSGNKLFKLHYFLQEALQSTAKKILTFGGAYSNHLVATAFACREYGLACTGIVRGERPLHLSHTLQQCLDYGMTLQFISREEYAAKENAPIVSTLIANSGEAVIIPEGGYHNLGADGAALINKLIPHDCTHICTAVGTATTLAGVLKNAGPHQQIIGVPVLKGMSDIEERVAFMLGNHFNKEQLQIFNNYHFGGYAKHTPQLFSFMNQLWQQQGLPTDFVYTAKLFFAVDDLIKAGHFAAGSRILCLHTGGLQGNNSLKPGTLLF